MDKDKLRKIVSKSSYWIGVSTIILGLVVCSAYEKIPVKIFCIFGLIGGLFMLVYHFTVTDNEKYFINIDVVKNPRVKKFLIKRRKRNNIESIMLIVILMIMFIVGLIL